MLVEVVKALIGIVLLAAFGIIVYKLLTFYKKRVKGIEKMGYEFLWQSSVSTDALWIKDDTVYFTKKHKLEDVQVAEVLGVSEIRRGAQLTALQIRYRVNGVVNEVQVGGSKSHMLTIMDKLGYGG